MGDGRASQCKAGEKRQVDRRLQRGKQGNARHGEACEEWVLPAGRDGRGGATAGSMVGMWRGVLVCGRCVGVQRSAGLVQVCVCAYGGFVPGAAPEGAVSPPRRCGSERSNIDGSLQRDGVNLSLDKARNLQGGK